MDRKQIFWNTISAYNSDTLWIQVIFIAAAVAVITTAWFRPGRKTLGAVRILMSLLNFWIASVYYIIYCGPREYNITMAVQWAVMGGIWAYGIKTGLDSGARTPRRKVALPIFLLPLAYPVCSLLLGRQWPEMTSPVMPCSVAVLSIGVMAAFWTKLNLVLAMLLCHWALIGLSKVYFYGIPEDYMLAACVLPAVFLFFAEYTRKHAGPDSKPSRKVLSGILITVSVIIAAVFAYTIYRQFTII